MLKLAGIFEIELGLIPAAYLTRLEGPSFRKLSVAIPPSDMERSSELLNSGESALIASRAGPRSGLMEIGNVW